MILSNPIPTTAATNDKVLKVRAAFRLPVDPLKIVSMADYDLTLLVCTNWFDFDDGRTAKPGLISKWSFDEKDGGYWFEISSKAKWSDGMPITSKQLVFNLNRIIKSDTSYGKSISTLLADSPAKIENDRRFFIQTSTKRPTDSFFQRMGSIFLSLVHPDDFGTDGNMKTNSRSSGPFILSQISDDELILQRNPFWFGHDLSNSPQKIIIRKPSPDMSFGDFLDGKTWENITQVASMMPISLSQKLLEMNLPRWTRDHDRVSLLKPVPGSEQQMARRKKVILSLWGQKNTFFKNLKLPIGVRTANSLQPIGYPLFNEILTGEISSSSGQQLQDISIAATDSLTSRTQMELLSPLFEKVGVKAKWTYIAKDKFIPLLTEDSNFDFVFFDFGVADPEPMTWVSLIVNMKFVHLDQDDLRKFNQLTKLHDRSEEVRGLKNLLTSIAKKGGYVSLLHFSTLSVAQPGISLEKIRELDETVDYSKVIFK